MLIISIEYKLVSQVNHFESTVTSRPLQVHGMSHVARDTIALWNCSQHPAIVGSVKVNFLSYRYRADKSTIFGMRGLWGLTINSGRGATLKYL